MKFSPSRRGVLRPVFLASVVAAASFLTASCASVSSPRTNHLVRYADVQIEVVAQGRGPLVVMLPSLGRDSDDYGPVAEAFARGGYRVLRPAPRGMGRSAGPAHGISLHHYAQDVAKVIEYEANGPAVVIGHAYGNWVARTVATDYPRLVRGVVIAAAASKNFDPRLRGYIDKCEDASLPDEERLKYLRMTFFAPGSDPKPWLQGWHPEVKKLQRAAREATKAEEFWGAGGVPMLDLMANEDPFRLPATRDENRREFGARVSAVVIPNASHALIPEQPAAVADAVSRWMHGLPHKPR
ncbi:MAG TPA: alpha/beta hydrolase [Burkholderiaceae bacterium]|nr:alpha/beta hydrolase [Burkholderiaceae bacterium]